MLRSKCFESRQSKSYLEKDSPNINEYRENFDLLTDELENLIVAHNKMAEREDDEAKKMLIDFTRLIAPFLKQGSFYSVLLDFCESTILAFETLETSIGWLHILKYEAHYALDAWNAALTDIQAVIEESHRNEPGVHAQAALSMGRHQLNRRNNREALATLDQAEGLLLEQNDYEGLAAAKAEVAVYYLIWSVD